MTIAFAKYANDERSVVEVQTVEAGAVLVSLNGPDVSGGWREVYSAWAQSNETAAFVAPVVRHSASDHLASFGFDTIALVNHPDTEAKFTAQGVPLPPKCAADRA